jgi:6-phosphogluconolactonase (cycloisomerase 2 family)
VAQAGKYLLVESMSAETATGIETYSIGSNGALTRATLASPSGPNGFTADGGSMAVDQKKKVVYVSGTSSFSLPNGSGGAPALGAYAISSNGSLSPLAGSPYNIQVGTLALDPLGRFVYAINNGQITAIMRNSDGSLGTLAPGSPMKLQGVPAAVPQETCAVAGQGSVAVSASGTFLYIACGGSTSLNVVSVDSGGRFTSVQSLAPTTPEDELSGLALNPSGTLLIATEEAANLIMVFRVDQASGKLTPVSSVAAGTRPNSATFDTSGSFAYVSNGSSLIGKNNFMAGSDNVSGYAVGKNGGITPVAGSPFSTGGAPRSIIVVQP